jgi:hypothetical protein
MDSLNKLIERKKKRELKLQKANEEKKALKAREAALQKEVAAADKKLWQATAIYFVEQIEKEGFNLSEINIEGVDYVELAAFLLEKNPAEKRADGTDE